MADEGFKRKLAAILSADVEGYSRLMDDDEEATVRTLTSFRTAIADIVQQFRGRVVDTPGDNILTEFTSVVDAVNCAVEIQRDLAERNAELPYNRKMEFRIGVNLGDVIEEEDRIYGDGINIAARVEAMAEAGGICITGRAYDQVANKLGLEYEHLGEHQVKNISTPIRVYRVLSYPGAPAHRVIQAKRTLKKKWLWVARSIIFILLIIFVGLYWKYYYLPSPTEIDSKGKITFDLPQGPSIAVLPFVNMSKDPDQEYFCDGITDNIIHALSHIPKLLVIARNSSFVYKGKSVKVQQIGYELGAHYVIEGSIQKSDEQIRITVQLIDTGSGHHMWSGRYDRELKDIFKLQDEITIEIMKTLQIYLTEGEQIRRRIEGVDDLQILSKLLKAFWYIYNDSKESNILARKEVEEIIALNPEISSAYFLLGFSYLVDLWYGACEYPLICFGKATEAARNALALDNKNSDAHFLAGYIFLLRKEQNKAIAEMKRAINLNPNNADAYANLGYALYCDNRPTEGVEFIKKALSLNPNPPSLYYLVLGNAYRGAKQYENAIKAYKLSLKIRPENNIFPHINLAVTYSILGREKEAHAAGLEVLKLDPNFSSKQNVKTMPHKNKALVESFYEGLRKAGLPE